MATVAELNVAITAETAGVERGFTDVQSRLKKFGDELQSVGAKMSIGITAPIALMGAAVMKVGQDYERSMNIFQSVTRASADEMARAGQVAQQLGADMTLPATSAGDAAKAMTELAKGGLTATEAMEATRGTLQLAAAAMIDEATAAEITANALNAFGLAASEAGRVSDLLAAAANASSAEITDIALSMQQASAVFASAKIPIEDLTTAIALMANAGIKGSDAGTSLKTMIIALSAPTDKAASEMKRLGINIFDAQGEFIPFRGMIEQVSNALKGMTAEQQAAALKTIFGTDALRAANIVMAKGTEAFDEMSKAVNRSGAAQELSAARAKGLSGAIDGLVSQLETLALKIYQSVAPGLESMVRMLADLVGNLAEADKAVLQAGVVMAGVFAAAGPIALGIGVIVSMIGGPLTLAIVGLTSAVGILAAEWVLDMNKMNQASTITAEDTKQKFISLAETIGHVMDAISFAANLISGTIKAAAGLMMAAFTPLLTVMFILEEGVEKGLKRIDTMWANANASYAQSTDAMAAAVEGRWSTMLGNLVRGMGAAQQQIVRGWGETERMFQARSRLALNLGGAGGAGTGNIERDLQASMKRVAAITGGGGRAAAKAFTEEFDKGMLEASKEAGEAATFFANKALEEIKEVFEDLPIPIRKFTDALELATAGITTQSNAMKDSIGFGRDWMAFIQEAKGKIESHARTVANMKEEYEDLSRSLPHAWNVIIEGFTKGISATSIKIKGFASDLINVFDAMPGKWGSALNRTLDEVNKWVNFIDAAIKLIQRMLGDKDPGGLGDVLSKIGGVFKKTTQDIKDATHDIGQGSEDWGERVATQMNKAATGTEAGAGRMVAAFGQIAGAALAFIGAKGQGVIGGAFSGALGGIAAAGGIATALGVALSPLTLGLSAAGGALLGGLIGLFTGKSAEQKAAEARAAEQAKLSMQQTAQTVINAAIQGFDSAIKFFENLEQFTAPRKAKFAEFWKAMHRLMNGFLDLAKAWVGTSLEQAKALSETIKPIAEAISALPDAFTAISGHFGLAQSSIDSFFNDFSRLMDAFFAKSEVWIDGVSKRAMKVANRLSPVVALISAFGTAMTDITGVKEPSDEMFAIFDRTIDKIVTHVANLSLKFDKTVLKTMANFAEKAGSALSIWKEAIESIKATVDIQAPSESSVDNVVAGIELFINKLGGAVERLITTDLARISAFANVIAPIAAAIKAWAETAEVVRGYTAIAAEVWDQIVTDFERGLVLLNLLILDAQMYVEKANIFKGLIDQGASVISAALATFGSSIAAAGSTLTGSLPQGGSPMGPTVASPSQMAPSARGPMSLTLVLQPGDPRTQAVVNFVEQTFGASVLNGTSSQFA